LKVSGNLFFYYALLHKDSWLQLEAKVVTINGLDGYALPSFSRPDLNTQERDKTNKTNIIKWRIKKAPTEQNLKLFIYHSLGAKV
jgi:hypothetical protein